MNIWKFQLVFFLISSMLIWLFWLWLFISDRWQRAQGALLTNSIKDGVKIETVRDKWDEVTEMKNGDFPTSNQEATMDLVSKMSPLTEDKPKIDPDAPFDPVSKTSFDLCSISLT